MQRPRRPSPSLLPQGGRGLSAAVGCAAPAAHRAAPPGPAARRAPPTAARAPARCPAPSAAPPAAAPAASRSRQQPRPRILPRRDRRRIGERRGQPPRQQPRPRRRQRPLHRAEQRVQRAAVARAMDLQAGARRRIHRQQPGAALRRRAGEARQRAGLGGAHIVHRHQRRDRLGVGEAAERVEAGDAERLRQPPPRHQRRRRCDLGRALAVPFAERQPRRRQDLRRLQPAEQAGQIRRRQRGGLEQAGGHVEPGRADAVAVLRQCRAADWRGRLPAAPPR